MTSTTSRMQKWPLLIAAAIILVRVLSEQLGAPESINFVFGVVWLYFIVPFSSCRRSSRMESPGPIWSS